jgi:hypothetical protein
MSDEGMRLDDARLPEGFVKVRGYVAHLLGLPVPAVYVRSEFGRQIHVAAVDRRCCWPATPPWPRPSAPSWASAWAGR